LQEGDIVTGVVTKLLPIGALVDIGGVTGLVHISQIRKGRVKDVADALSLGDEVIARVLKVEANTARVALSIKAGLQVCVHSQTKIHRVPSSTCRHQGSLWCQG
jgi:small subunit ribosomal protein S1